MNIGSFMEILMLFDGHFMNQMEMDLKDYKLIGVKKADEVFVQMDFYVNKTKKNISTEGFMIGYYDNNKSVFTWNQGLLKMMKKPNKKDKFVKVHKFFSKMLKKKVKVEFKMHRALIYFYYLFFVSKLTAIMGVQTKDGVIHYFLTELPMRKKFKRTVMDSLLTAVSAINK